MDNNQGTPQEPPAQEPGQQQAPASPPEPQQQQPADWRASLPSELREAPQLKDVADIGSLAKQFVDQQRFLGNSIRIPGADAGPEAKQEFFSKLQRHAPELILRPDPTNEQAMAEFWSMAGVPSDVNGYTPPEGVELNEKWLENTKAMAKKYGLTGKAFKDFVSDTVARETAQLEQNRAMQTEDMKTLQSEWGMATDARINDIKKFSEVMGMPESFREALNENQVSSDWLKAIHNIIQQFGGLGEGQEVAFQPGGSIPDSPAELKAKIAEIEANPAFLNQRDPTNKTLVQKRFELIQQLNKAA